jgi:hypothetical protein
MLIYLTSIEPLDPEFKNLINQLDFILNFAESFRQRLE